MFMDCPVTTVHSHNCGKNIVSRRNISSEVEVALPHELHYTAYIAYTAYIKEYMPSYVGIWLEHLLTGFLKLERGGLLRSLWW